MNQGNVPCSYAASSRAGDKSPPTARRPCSPASETGGKCKSSSSTWTFMVQRNSPCVSFACMGEMNVQAQIAALSEVLTSRPLPGWPSQSLACPPGRPRDLEERVRDARQAGVVSLLCWHNGQWQVLLMLRTRDNTPHSGQLAFPGGAAEALDGGDLTRTALRELEEEVGISLREDQIMGWLSPIYIPPSHFFVQPWWLVVTRCPTFGCRKKKLPRSCGCRCPNCHHPASLAQAELRVRSGKVTVPDGQSRVMCFGERPP